MVAARRSSAGVRGPQVMGRSDGVVAGLVQWLMFAVLAVLVVAMGVFMLTGGMQGHAEELYDDEKYQRIMGEPKPGSADVYTPNAPAVQQPTPTPAQAPAQATTPSTAVVGDVFNENPAAE